MVREKNLANIFFSQDYVSSWADGTEPQLFERDTTPNTAQNKLNQENKKATKISLTEMWFNKG